jgi:cytochrome P450
MSLPRSALSHVPGPPTMPIVGHTLDIVRDSYGFQKSTAAKYGEVFRATVVGVERVVLRGADALEMVLIDRDGTFSSREGWQVIEPVFSGGLMLRDFDDHRAHRRIMQTAFRAPAMEAYLARLGPEMDTLVGELPADGAFRFYPAIKELALRVGAATFLGLPVRSEMAVQLNKDLIDEIAASLAVIRWPVPFTPMHRGIAARRRLSNTLRDMIPVRRATGGDDFFSQMCRAEDEEGGVWSDDEIVDHFNFLMMAAHDTTATGITAMVWGLAAHPEWQEAVADEVASLEGEPLDMTALDRLEVTDMVFREGLRLVPPVPFIPRQAVKPFQWAGFDLPAGTPITITPGMTMIDPAFWSDPESFDPARFAHDRAEDRRHKFARAPFGGGAHKCIGMHFSTMQAKAFIVSLARRFRVSLAGHPPVWQRMPIPRPKDGLPIVLSRRAEAAHALSVAAQ